MAQARSEPTDGIATTQAIRNSAMATKPGNGKPAIGGRLTAIAASTPSVKHRPAMRANLTAGDVAGFQRAGRRNASRIERWPQRAGNRHADAQQREHRRLSTI